MQTLTGKHLIEIGFNPGKGIEMLLNHLNNKYPTLDLKIILAKSIFNHPSPREDIWEEELKPIINELFPKKYDVVIPHIYPIEYDKYVDSDNDEELENIISVEETMNVVMKTPTVVRGAIMPDACPSGNIGHIPVGGLVVTENAIHPSMHSADICCSVMITGYGNNEPKRILDIVHDLTEFGSGPRRKNHKFEISNDLFDRICQNKFFNERAKGMAKSHLGTQGDGNHFAFVGKSKNTGETCLVTHHGSRGLGAALYKEGMLCAEKWRKRLCPSLPSINAWIPFDTEDGREYWNALQLVREWTKLNHEVLHFGIRDKVKYVSKLHFWNEHNFIFKKDNLFYHAKGSTPMLDMIPDNDTGLRLIPLNMAQPILIVSNNEKNELGFAPHGAGRNLSRTNFIKKKLNIQDEINGLDVRFYFDNPDKSEFPSAYKNADWLKEQILKYNLCNIEDEIFPYGCIMAGNTNFQRQNRN